MSVCGTELRDLESTNGSAGERVGRGSRYKLLGTGGQKWGRVPSMLHMFLSFSELSLFMDRAN